VAPKQCHDDIVNGRIVGIDSRIDRSVSLIRVLDTSNILVIRLTSNRDSREKI
jgi:hypothetical protein